MSASREKPENERGAAFYDAKVREVPHWTLHYTASHYYPVWTVIADRLERSGCTSVLDIGCGPGQVGAMLADRGWRNYRGVDFSPAMVLHAKKACPDFHFEVRDVVASGVVAEGGHDCVIALEFLEHVVEDLAVLSGMRPGTTLLGTVPNFPARSHVRHFKSADEVRARYAALFDPFDVSAIRAGERGAIFWVVQGMRR